jgi:Na+/H+-dicarboxylate symporter
VFAILLGISLILAGKVAEPVIRVMEGVAEGMYKMTAIVMELAPYGVFALMASVSAQYGLDILIPLIKVLFGVYLGCIIHAVVTLGGSIAFIARLNPLPFFQGIVDALAVAYTTASSSGTLPITIRCARRNLGVSDSISSFVLPLGATINMDGTAMYQGVAALFIAQAYGIDLIFSDYVMIILTSTLASIGSAGVPGAGLIMLTLVLNSVGLPIEGIAIIAGIDRILDMARTTVNVVGDCMVTVLVAKSEGELDEDIYNIPRNLQSPDYSKLKSQSKLKVS